MPLTLSLLFCVYFINKEIAWNTEGMYRLFGEDATLSVRKSSCSCYDEETSRTYNFCYNMSWFNENDMEYEGERFNCTILPFLKKLNLLEPHYQTEADISKQVFVTGASANHFTEVLDQLSTTVEHFSSHSNARILFYDFGLNEPQAMQAKSICHVEYRKFNYSQYPPYVQNMTNYRWKPLIIAELMLEFNAFWWTDSSIQWTTSDLSDVYDAVETRRLSSYLLPLPTGHSIKSTTNPRKTL